MNFAGLAGDDEHTAIEGPYARLMKTRKWLVISSALAALVVFRVYDPVATKELIRITEIPDWLFANAVLGGLGYLAVQYGLLLYQLWITYDLTLNERLKFRRADDLAKAVDASRSAERDLVEAKSGEGISLTPHPADIRRAEKALRVAENNVEAAQIKLHTESVPGTISWTLADNELEEAKQLLDEAEAEIAKIGSKKRALIEKAETRNARISAAQKNFDKAMQDLEELARQDPSKRGRYIWAEKAIDTLRLAPPALAGIAAILSLVIMFHSWTYRWLIFLFESIHA